MGKIKQLLENQKNSIRDIFLNRYTFTICLGIIICIFLVVLDVTDYNSRMDGLWPEYILNFLWIFALGILFAETLFKGDRGDEEAGVKVRKYSNVTKITVYALFALLSVIAVILGYNSEDIFFGKGEELFGRALVFYIVLLCGLTLFYMIRNSKLGLQKYIVSVVFGLIKVSVVILAMNIGLILLLELFSTLIVEINEWNFLENLEILLTGFLYVPYALICLTDEKEEKSKFARFFILFILMPMVLIGTGILYLYLFRIMLFSSSIPSNEIFPICAYFFVICAPIWTMAYAFVMDAEKQGLYAKIIKILKFLYTPFLIMEIYSMGARIYAYGITEERYAAVIFILFQLIYLLWEPMVLLVQKMKKTSGRVYGIHYEWMIPIFFGISFLALFAPVINYQYLTYLSQKTRFEKVYQELKQLTETDTESVEAGEKASEFRSIYYALGRNYDGHEYLKNHYTKAEMEEFLSMEQVYYNEYAYVYYEAKIDGLDVEGYSTIYDYYYNDRYGDDPLPLEHYANIELWYADDQRVISVDFRSVMQQLYEEQYGSESKNSPYRDYWDNEPIVIEPDEHHKVIIRNISYRCIEEKEAYYYLSVNGYVLER